VRPQQQSADTQGTDFNDVVKEASKLILKAAVNAAVLRGDDNDDASASQGDDNDDEVVYARKPDDGSANEAEMNAASQDHKGTVKKQHQAAKQQQQQQQLNEPHASHPFVPVKPPNSKHKAHTQEHESPEVEADAPEDESPAISDISWTSGDETVGTAPRTWRRWTGSPQVDRQPDAQEMIDHKARKPTPVALAAAKMTRVAGQVERLAKQHQSQGSPRMSWLVQQERSPVESKTEPKQHRGKKGKKQAQAPKKHKQTQRKRPVGLNQAPSTSVDSMTAEEQAAMRQLRKVATNVGSAALRPLKTLLHELQKETLHEKKDSLNSELPSPVLFKMIRSEAWVCDLIPVGDARHFTCGVDVESDSLDRERITCGEDDSCSIEHANAYRTLSQIGSLPCCPTAPFCSAPSCDITFVQSSPAECTKRSAEENVAFMKQPDTWPAYHGWGGSFELDTLKLLDVIACKNGVCPPKAFDLAIDLGANTGYYSEKLTVRNIAEHYIMIEANPLLADVLRSRYNNKTWKESWFTEQVNLEDHGDMPDFLVINHALSNHSEGLLDMCQTEVSLKGTEEGCEVPIASVDHLVPHSLTDNFKDHLKNAQSAYIKIDTEGMDELVLRGMEKLLSETRGTYEDGSDRYLVNFMQFEFAPALMKLAKKREGFRRYDIKTVTKFLESIGFESFLIGPRYLPLSHGSWDDEFKTWTEDPRNNAGSRENYPDFDDSVCAWCHTMDEPSFTADVFVMRQTHPRNAEIKVALGACLESKDFKLEDPHYERDVEKDTEQEEGGEREEEEVGEGEENSV
jgi:FkbM family methyltransferase